MRKFIPFLLSQLIIFSVLSQNTFNCISHDVFSEQMQNNAAFRNNQTLLEKQTQNYLAANQSQKPSAAAYVLPIVFHVIYTTANGNISDAQIQDQVAILNREFNRLQADTALTPLPFKPLAAPFSVEFRLPTKDPNGNCTTGIEHIYNTMATCSFSWDAVKAISYWPNNKYINVWLIETMRYPGNGNNICMGGGYATFPGGPDALDGIVMRSDLIGSIGTAQSTSWGNWKGRYLIHELGHWFNLRHIWGDVYCGDDLVNDTPPAVFSNSNCPSFPHNANNACGSDGNGEMFNDYMDYSNGNCLNMFSAGQVTRMTAAINSWVSGRANLWNASNLNATGTSDPYTYPALCGAVPDILPHEPVFACAGDSVKITDLSYGGPSTSRLWSFPGGMAANYVDSIVWVKYSSEGVYPVTLTKNFSGNSKTQTFSNRVCITSPLPNANYSFPFRESFENPILFEADWKIINRNADSAKWVISDLTNYTGYNCAGIWNFDQAAPLSDDLISPGYDLSSVESPTLSFRLFFAGKVTENFDRLQVSVSKDCGKTWSLIYQKHASSTLKTVPADITSSYYPAFGSTEWRLEKINISPLNTGSKVNFKFSFTSGGGNNIFIDDISIEGVSTVGMDKFSRDLSFYVFPNPATSQLHLKISPGLSLPARVVVTDLTGRQVISETLTENETNDYLINTAELLEGAYLLNVVEDQRTVFSHKLIILGMD